ncbi:class 1 fructose-bisphosphatase [bacterium]|nr:class 1 fructose-bisphosphatase [bacterium]MBU1982962.1 class 1 fructose-bisphosphatase [bacterium]
MSDIITIERHILHHERENPEATGQLTRLLYQIAYASKVVSHEVRRAGLIDIIGTTGDLNVQGEAVEKLDAIAEETFYAAFDHIGVLCCMTSEEVDDVIPIPAQFDLGKYTLAFDPLDGSSNIAANVNVGTIFSVHRKITHGRDGNAQDLLQPGRRQVVAGYVMYGSSTMMVYTTGRGVYGFTLEPSMGEFLLSHPDIRIPEQGKIFSCNMGNYRYWSEGVRKYVDDVMSTDQERGRPYSSRYIGSLVADAHRTLLYGGIFMYPMDYKDPKKPKGKLRLLYEASPMAFVFEQAGGKATNGDIPILDVKPKELHERTPLFLGSKRDVDEAMQFIKQHG